MQEGGAGEAAPGTGAVREIVAFAGVKTQVVYLHIYGVMTARGSKRYQIYLLKNLFCVPFILLLLLLSHDNINGGRTLKSHDLTGFSFRISCLQSLKVLICITCK